MGLAVGWWRSHEEVRLRPLGMAEGGDSHEEAGQSLYRPPACSSKEARSPEAWRAWLPVSLGHGVAPGAWKVALARTCGIHAACARPWGCPDRARDSTASNHFRDLVSRCPLTLGLWGQVQAWIREQIPGPGDSSSFWSGS